MRQAEEARIPMVLTAYGIPHSMGYLPTRGGVANPHPLETLRLFDLAVELGLAGVELPLPPASVLSPEAIREALQARDLQVVVDYMAVLDSDVEALHAALKAASIVGAKVFRMLLSRVLCGDRRSLPGGWEAHLAAVARRLREVLPLAEDLGMVIALENHQDATIEDLIRLAEWLDSPAYGITLDAGNPLAVGQDPVEAARELAPWIRHIHLKDYTLHFAPEGYRLVRCAAGTGVVDFPAILNVVRANGAPILPGIEIAAQATRTIPFLDKEWWYHYPERAVPELLPVLQLLWQKGRPAEEPYSSAWERGEESAAICKEEEEVLRRSVAYFRSLTALASSADQPALSR